MKTTLRPWIMNPHRFEVLLDGDVVGHITVANKGFTACVPWLGGGWRYWRADGSLVESSAPWAATCLDATDAEVYGTPEEARNAVLALHNLRTSAG